MPTIKVGATRSVKCECEPDVVFDYKRVGLMAGYDVLFPVGIIHRGIISAMMYAA